MIFRRLMSIKIETLKPEYERAGGTDVFRKGDTAYKQKLTHPTRLQMFISSAAVLALHSK
jgi:hypothetical protein